MEDLINWQALSRFLANNHTISATRCPKKFDIANVVVPKSTLCDVCGSDDVIEAPSMGRNCNTCNPI